jgi:hypothetical protein
MESGLYKSSIEVFAIMSSVTPATMTIRVKQNDPRLHLMYSQIFAEYGRQRNAPQGIEPSATQKSETCRSMIPA